MTKFGLFSRGVGGGGGGGGGGEDEAGRAIIDLYK
jgi:hypothetical protein